MARDPTKFPPNNLRAWRVHRGLTQAAVARTVGTTGPVISLIEKSERRLSHGWLNKIAPLLQTTPGAILDFMPEDIDGDILRAAMNVPLERLSDAIALLRWLGRESVHLTTVDTDGCGLLAPAIE